MLLNRWSFIAINITQNGETVYLNGQSATVQNIEYIATPADPLWIIGTQLCCGNMRYFHGYISNVQLYNTSLSANEINALYTEGIGGVPIILNNLVGWWPLNGNANDYSGNQDSGVSNNVIFTTSWASGYSSP